MAEIEMDDFASVGQIIDVPAYQIKPEGFSLTNNMRYFAEGVEKLKGDDLVFNSPVPQSPAFLLYVSAPQQPFWLWTSLTDAFVWDGISNTNITRATGTYGTAANYQWNGCLIGGVPILNNGVDAPQYWASYSTSQKLQPLTAWPASTSCRVIRQFLVYLIAMNITSAGGASPHEVRWSNEAAPGSLPTTWDFTDLTKNAGRVFLGDVDSGQILDGMELGGQFFVYKENAVWRFVFIGGTFIFDDKAWLETAGILATNCVVVTGDGMRHCFLTQDDLMVHNGISAEPLLNRRMKRYLFNQIEPTQITNCFLLSNPPYEEVWVCYPSVGQILANRALIWNYRYNTLSEADVGFVRGAIGTFSQSSGRTWAAATGTWGADVAPWSNQLRRKVVVCDYTNKNFYMLDTANPTRHGNAFNGTLQRIDFGVIGKKRSGEWIEDFEHLKMVQAIWPKIIAASPVQIQAGYQQVPNGPVAWNMPASFNPTTDVKVDDPMLGSGRAFCYQISSFNDFRLDGLKFDMTLMGKF